MAPVASAAVFDDIEDYGEASEKAKMAFDTSGGGGDGRGGEQRQHPHWHQHQHQHRCRRRRWRQRQRWGQPLLATTAMSAAAMMAAAAAMAAEATVAAVYSVEAAALTMTSVTQAAAVAAMLVMEATATATVMMATATTGVKRQQSPSVRTVEGGQWTQAQWRVTTNNERTWPMMRAATKRVARVMATATRVAGERQRR